LLNELASTDVVWAWLIAMSGDNVSNRINALMLAIFVQPKDERVVDLDSTRGFRLKQRS
jgi:hypothetical protein